MANMNTTWRLLDTGFNNPYMNMAVDEALIQETEDSDSPILRFYSWSQPAISIGYSQRVGEVLKVGLCEKEEIPIVRRPTGGGVVFHGVDITYSVVLPKGFTSGIQETFLWIQSNIKDGLLSLGINTILYNKRERTLPGYCFASPNIGDLMEQKRKLAGLAGRRIKRKILCQGYVYFGDASGMLRLVKGLKSLKNKAVSIRELSGRNINQATVKEAIVRNWPEVLVKDTLNDREEQLTSTLYEAKYSQDEWNYRR